MAPIEFHNSNQHGLMEKNFFFKYAMVLDTQLQFFLDYFCNSFFLMVIFLKIERNISVPYDLPAYEFLGSIFYFHVVIKLYNSSERKESFLISYPQKKKRKKKVKIPEISVI